MKKIIFTYAWATWITWFVVWEGIALFNKTQDDTLSAHTWDWIGDHKWRMIFVIVFLGWLTIHFVKPYFTAK